MKFDICIVETGDHIETAKTLDEAMEILNGFENEDKADGTYTPNFYGVYDENRELVY